MYHPFQGVSTFLLETFGRDWLDISHRLHFLLFSGPNATVSKGSSLIRGKTPDYRFFGVIWHQILLVKLRAKSSSTDQRKKPFAIQVKKIHAISLSETHASNAGGCYNFVSPSQSTQSFLFSEPQNHGMVEVGRELWGSSGPNPCSSRAT